MNLIEIWRRITMTRYTRDLEGQMSRLHEEVARERTENVRLRAENRALLNSILGIAGIPPIVVPDMAQEPVAAGTSDHAPRTQRGEGKGTVATAMRRRSWHQVMRGLELATARKDRPDTP